VIIADASISRVKVLAALTCAEADRRGKSTGWHWISTSQVDGASQGWCCINASWGLARQ